jgi:hypothetical protein
MKIGIYTRFSSKNDGDESIIDQVNTGIEWCNSNGYEYEVYDEGVGVSGGLKFEDREVGRRFIKDIKNKKLGGVYIKNWKRLIRNRREGWKLIELFEDYDIKLFNDGRDIDYKGDGYYELMFENVSADSDRKTIAYNIRRGKIRKLERGEYCMSKWLYGYRKEYEVRDGVKVSRLVKDEVEGEILLKVLNRFLDGDIGKFSEFREKCNIEFGLNKSLNFYKFCVKEDYLDKYNGYYKMEFFANDDLNSNEKKMYDINAEVLVNNILYDKVLKKSRLFTMVKGRWEKDKDDNIFKGMIFCGKSGKSMWRKTKYNIKTIYKNSKRVKDIKLGVRKDEKGNVVYIWNTSNSDKRLVGFENKDGKSSIYNNVLDTVIREVVYYVLSNSQTLKKDYLDFISKDSGVEIIENDINKFESYIDKIEGKMKRLNTTFVEGWFPNEDDYKNSMRRYVKEKGSYVRKVEELRKEMDELGLKKSGLFGWKDRYNERYSKEKIMGLSDKKLKEYVNDLIDIVLIDGIIGEEVYNFKFYFKYRLIGDKVEFDKKHWYDYKKENLKLFNSNKNKFYKNFRKKFNIKEGNDILDLSLKKGELTDNNNLYILIKCFLLCCNFEVILSSRKSLKSIVFIGFIKD